MTTPITRPRSHHIFHAGERCIPGGVNSPVRAFRSVGLTPVVASRGHGSYIEDVDGNRYIDFIGSWGPLIFGHSPDFLVAEIAAVAANGTTFGLPTAREVEFAELLCQAIPSFEMVRLVSSGTEAVMTAIRLARAFTKRKLVLKFEGGYHGHSDGLLAEAGSGLATQGIPSSAGVPPEFAHLTISIPFNNLETLRSILNAKGNEVACLIAEPIPANMGVVAPLPGYWNAVRKLLNEHGALLIFDEVITGFRMNFGAYHEQIGVQPDLSTLGKIIGGGLPMGAVGGKADIMRLLAPEGPVYQAGTLSGNPLAVAAGLATLHMLKARNPYAQLEEKTHRLVQGIRLAAKEQRIPVYIAQAGSLFTIFFTQENVTDFSSAKTCDTKRFSQFFQGMLRGGVLPPPSQFEAWFVSCAHSDQDINATIAAATESFRMIQE